MAIAHGININSFGNAYIRPGEVAVLVNDKKNAGRYQVQWDASAMPSGIYFYKLQAGPFQETKWMILMK